METAIQGTCSIRQDFCERFSHGTDSILPRLWTGLLAETGNLPSFVPLEIAPHWDEYHNGLKNCFAAQLLIRIRKRTIGAIYLPIDQPSDALRKVHVVGVTKSVFIVKRSPHPQGLSFADPNIRHLCVSNKLRNYTSQNPVLTGANS